MNAALWHQAAIEHPKAALEGDWPGPLTTATPGAVRAKSSSELDNCRRRVAMVSVMAPPLATMSPRGDAVAVAIGVGEIVLATAIFAHGLDAIAGVALTFGLWILGRSLHSAK